MREDIRLIQALDESKQGVRRVKQADKDKLKRSLLDESKLTQ